MSLEARAQMQVSWVKNGGGSASEIGMDICADVLGNSYATGYLNNESNSSPRFGTDTLKGNQRIPYLVKHDRFGNRIWIRQIQGDLSDVGSAIALNSTENELVWVGYYASTNAQIDTFSLPAPALNSSRMFVVKLDTSGNVKWVHTEAVPNPKSHVIFPVQTSAKVAIDAFDNIYLGGVYLDQATLGSTVLNTPYSTSPVTGTKYESFVAKLDSTGSVLWAKNITSLGYTALLDLALDQAQQVYCVGRFNDTLSFADSTIISWGSNDGFVAKLDTAGKVLWLNKVGGKKGDEARSIVVNPNNDVLITGHYTDTGYIDTLTLAAPGHNTAGFLAKLDTAGRLKWVVEGTEGTVKPIGLGVDIRSHYVITGEYGYKMKWGNIELKSTGSSSGFYAVMDSSGNCIWAENIGGVGGVGFGAAADTSSNFYLTGWFHPIGVFGDLIANNNGFADVFVFKLSDCQDADTARISGPSNLLACSGGTIRLSSNNDPLLEYQWLYNGFQVYPGTDSTFDAAQAGDYRVVISDDGCLDTSAAITIGVTPGPSVSLATFPTVCTKDSNFTLTQGSPSGGVYQGIGVINDTVFSPSGAGIGSYNILYTYTDTNGCKDSAQQNIEVGGQSASLLPMADVCANATDFNLSGGSPSGGTYSGTGVVANRFYPSVAGVGTHTIRYIYQSASCLDTATATLTVLSVQSASIGTLPSQCISDPQLYLSPYGTPAGGHFVGTAVNFVLFDPGAAGAGTHNLSYVVTTGICSDTATKSIYVDSLPQAKLDSFPAICVHDNPKTLSGGSPSGGIYRVNGITQTAVDPGALGLGTHTVEYLFTNLCGTDTATRQIQVTDTQLVALSNFIPVCAGDSAFTLTGGTPSGGTYSGNGVSAGRFDPAVAGPGTHAITYQLATGQSCTDTAIKNMVVYSQPVVSLSLVDSICVDASAFTLSGESPTGGTYQGIGISGNQFHPDSAGVGVHTISYAYTDGNNCTDSALQTIEVLALPSLSPFTSSCLGGAAFHLQGGQPTGGTYTGVGVSAGQFDPAIAGVGNHLITYSDAAGCGSDTASIRVDTTPVVQFAALADVCNNDPTFPLSGGSPTGTGGYYSGPGVNAGLFDPSLTGSGTYTLYYVFVDGNGCTDSSGQTIRVKAVPSVTLSAFSALCSNDTALTLNSGSPIGGVYSGTGVSLGKFSPFVAGSGRHLITYSKTDTNGCSESDTAGILVHTAPVVNFSALTSACEGAATFTLTGGSPFGGSYSGVGVSAGQFNPSLSGVGNHTVQYRFVDSNQCADSSTQVQVVHALPTLNFPALNSTCEQSATLVLNSATPSGGVYSGTGVVGSTFNPQFAGVGSHSITYTYTDPVTLCSDSLSQNLVVDSNPIASIPTYSNLCSNHAAMTLTGALPTGGTYSGPGVSGGQFDPGLAGSGNHTLTYIFSDSKGCRDTANSILVVDTTPVVSFTPLSAICHQSTAKTLSGGSPAGGVYKGSGVSTGQFDPQLAGLGSHTLRYVVVDGNNCSDSATQVQVVDTTPTISFTLIDSICINGGQLSLQATPAGGNYTGTGVSGNNFDPVLAGKGKHHLTYSYTASNGCPNSSTDSIRVDSLTPLQFLLPDSICQNAGVLQLTASPVGGNYSGTGVSGNQFDPTLLSPQMYAVKYLFTNGFGCRDSLIENIRLDSVPVVTQTTWSALCNKDSLILSGGSPLGGTYSGNQVNAGIFAAQATAGKHGITYTFTDSRGCADSSTDSLVVLETPQVSLGGPGVLCENTPAFLLNQGQPAGGKYFGSGIIQDTLFFAALAGTGNIPIAYQYQASNGCSDSVWTTWTVDTVPIVHLPAMNDPCAQDQAFRMTQGTPIGGTYSGSGVIQDTLFDPSVGFGDHIITYQFTDGKGCSDKALDTLRVDTLIQVASLNLPSLCMQNETLLLTGGMPAGGSYRGTGVIQDTLFAPKDLNPGSYTITYKLSNRCGSDSASGDLTLYPLPSLTLDSVPIHCEGDPAVNLQTLVHPSGGEFYVDGIQTSILGSFQTTDPIKVVYQYTDSNACFNELLHEVVIYPRPEATIEGEDEYCTKDSVRLTSAAQNMRYYLWNGDSSSSYVYPLPSAFGISEIHLEVVDSNGCKNEAVKNVLLTNCSPGISFYPNPNNGSFWVEIEGAEEEIVLFRLINAQGQLILDETHQVLAGHNAFSFGLIDVSGGTYVLEIQINGESRFEKVVVQ